MKKTNFKNFFPESFQTKAKVNEKTGPKTWRKCESFHWERRSRMLALICYLENKKRRASVVRNLRRDSKSLRCQLIHLFFSERYLCLCPCLVSLLKTQKILCIICLILQNLIYFFSSWTNRSDCFSASGTNQFSTDIWISSTSVN